MTRARKTLLLCNGEPPSRTLVRRLASWADEIVAADGGANIAMRFGITPNIIIGDLDSMSSAARRHFAGHLILKVSRQDNTDLEKSLDFLSGGGRREVVIVGATGRRIDFTLANFASAWKFISRLVITFAADGWRAIPVRGLCRVKAKRGTTVSLIPFGPCSGITLRGLRWPLTNAAMKVGDIAVSNVVLSSPFTVNVKKGVMMLFILD